MGTKQQQKPRSKGASAALVIVGCAIVAHAFFYLFCGLGSFWMKGDPMSRFDAETLRPLPNDMFAALYEGGFVIPIVITLLLTVVALSVERWFAIGRAVFPLPSAQFVMEVKNKLDASDMSGATDPFC